MKTIDNAATSVFMIFFHWGIVAGIYYISRFYVQYRRRRSELPATRWEQTTGYLAAISYAAIAAGIFVATVGGDHLQSQEIIPEWLAAWSIIAITAVVATYNENFADAHRTVEERRKIKDEIFRLTR